MHGSSHFSRASKSLRHLTTVPTPLSTAALSFTSTLLSIRPNLSGCHRRNAFLILSFRDTPSECACDKINFATASDVTSLALLGGRVTGQGTDLNFSGLSLFPMAIAAHWFSYVFHASAWRRRSASLSLCSPDRWYSCRRRRRRSSSRPFLSSFFHRASILLNSSCN